MTLADTLLEFPVVPADPTIEAFKAAVLSGAIDDLPRPLANLAGRVVQARKKIDSGQSIANVSELFTTAQFGAGSIGAAIAHILDEPEVAQFCEAVCIAKYLVATSIAAEGAHHLFPRDLCKRLNLTTESIEWPATIQLHEEMQQRAADILDRQLSELGKIERKGLKKAMTLEIALLQKKIQYLRGRNPSGVKLGLTWIDRLRIGLRGIRKT
jgi:hypothetical protein